MKGKLAERGIGKKGTWKRSKAGRKIKSKKNIPPGRGGRENLLNTPE